MVMTVAKLIAVQEGWICFWRMESKAKLLRSSQLKPTERKVHLIPVLHTTANTRTINKNRLLINLMPFFSKY
jgi:hypothetical protein